MPRGVQKLCHAVKSRDLQRDRVYEPYARLEGRFEVVELPPFRTWASFG